MARTKKRKKGGWLRLFGLAALLAAMILLSARLRSPVSRGLPAFSVNPEPSLQGFQATLDSMAASGWQNRRQADSDSGEARWRVAVPHSLPLVSANLALSRMARRNGLELLAVSEDRRRGILDISLGDDGATMARLSVRKRQAGEGEGPSLPMLALVAYEVKGDWAAQLRRLADCPSVMTLACGRKAAGLPEVELAAFLPMEPKGYPRQDPGPNTILVDDNPAVIRSKASRLLAANQGTLALCLHHGSRAVEDGAVMDEVARFCAAKNLSFLEPLPTASSLGAAFCRRAGAEYFKPDVYIVVSASLPEAKASLARAVKAAEKSGQALVFLPATENSVRAAREMFPPGRKLPCRLVAFSKLEGKR